MTNEFNIKEIRFPTVTYSGGMAAAGSTVVFGSQPLNGQLLSIQWQANIIGSLTLTTSGVGTVLWQNKAPSGTTVQTVNVGLFRQLATGSVAGGWMDNYYLTDKIQLQYDIGSNAVANLSGLSYSVNVRYR